MPNIKQYIKSLKDSLKELYQTDEALSIAKYYVQEKLSLSSTDLLIQGDDMLSEKTLNILEHDVKRLLTGEPVQYVTNTAWFCDHKFYVDKNVLIPRQETEILIHEVLEYYKEKKNLKILDIGTGSGCIPISLKKAIPDSIVYALDISRKAIEVARRNALENEVSINFILFDVLQGEKPAFDEKFDIIISNPPYVTDSEKKLMHKNVTSFEPDLALYVSDDNPLLFYKNTLQKFKDIINTDGTIWFEINENYADEVIELCQRNGFNKNIIIKDLNKKNRFIKSYF